MIKSTFLNLNREKKDMILAAARKELERTPVHNAKIANIIKDAGIPRGSFYQYFDTLNDVFMAVLIDIETGKQNDFAGFLDSCRGDLFNASIKMFISELSYFPIKPGIISLETC